MAINKRKRETAARLILLAGSVGLGLVALEVIGRTTGLLALVAPPQGDIFAASNLHDPEVRHIHPSHLHASGSLKGGDITASYRIPRAEMTTVKYDLQYDENGFRNKTDLKNADIVVIGDSFVEAITTPDAELINARLGQIRGETVANLGQYDYGPIEELAVLRRYGLPLRPHTVVWMFFEGNDLSDVARRYPAPVPGGTSGISAPPAPQPRRFFLRELVSRLRQRWRQALRQPGVKRAGILKTSQGGDRTVWFRYPAQPLSAKDISALDETARIIGTAEKLCSDNGAHLLFVFIPIKYRALHESCRFPAGSECGKWVLNDMPERLRKAVGPSPDAGFIDLTQSYADAARKGVLAYIPDDDHWSSDGQNLAAEVVNDYISSKWGK
jgi:hypothetical protein